MSLPASTQTGLPIRQLILDAMGAALDAVSGVVHVYRHRESVSAQLDYPSLRLVDRGDATERKIQHLHESRLQFEVWAYIQDYDREERRQDVAQLRAAVEAALMADEKWGDKAVQTNLTSADEHQSEITDPDGFAVVLGEVVYRTELTNPNIVAEL